MWTMIKNRKICCYSEHVGPPTVSAPGFDSTYSMGCAGGCGCGGGGGGGCGGCGGNSKVCFIPTRED